MQGKKPVLFPMPDARKIIQEAVKLGLVDDNIMCVAPEFHMPEKIIILWCSPKTMSDLIKLKILKEEK